jgi:hypothetical protein
MRAKENSAVFSADGGDEYLPGTAGRTHCGFFIIVNPRRVSANTADESV